MFSLLIALPQSGRFALHHREFLLERVDVRRFIRRLGSIVDNFGVSLDLLVLLLGGRRISQAGEAGAGESGHTLAGPDA